MPGITLELTSVGKRFDDVRALQNIDLRVTPGSVHALLGANGSGKSTLVKVITGIHAPDDGRILVDGRAIRSITPQTAERIGIRSVQQESPLVESMSVAENYALFRGFPRRAMKSISWRRLRRHDEAGIRAVWHRARS